MSEDLQPIREMNSCRCEGRHRLEKDVRSRKVERWRAIDGQQMYGETARGNMQTSGVRLKVHLWIVSGDAHAEGCLNCQKTERRKLSASLQSASQPQRARGSCPFGHSEFNLCSVGSSDFVRLNPGPYLSTLPEDGWDGKRRGGEAEKAAGGGFADNDAPPQGQSGRMKPGKTKPVISRTYERQREKGFKIMQQKKERPWRSPPRSVPEDWPGFCCFICFIHPLVTL